jgi:hypothetical protein
MKTAALPPFSMLVPAIRPPFSSIETVGYSWTWIR